MSTTYQDHVDKRVKEMNERRINFRMKKKLKVKSRN